MTRPDIIVSSVIGLAFTVAVVWSIWGCSDPTATGGNFEKATQWDGGPDWLADPDEDGFPSLDAMEESGYF